MPAVPQPHVQARRRARLKRLRELGYKDYPSYLRSRHWQRVRAAYRASDHPQECICGEADALQLHHRTYLRIGAEDLDDLVLLCVPCHQAVHVLEQRGDIGLDLDGLQDDGRAAAYAAERVEVADPLRRDLLKAEFQAAKRAYLVGLVRLSSMAWPDGTPQDARRDVRKIVRALNGIESKF